MIKICGMDLDPEVIGGAYCLVPFHYSSRIAVITGATDSGQVMARQWSTSRRRWTEEAPTPAADIERLSYQAHGGDWLRSPPAMSTLFG